MVTVPNKTGLKQSIMCLAATKPGDDTFLLNLGTNSVPSNVPLPITRPAQGLLKVGLT